MEQIAGQLRIRFQRRFGNIHKIAAWHPEGWVLGSVLPEDWIAPTGQLPDAKEMQDGEWQFLSQRTHLGRIPDFNQLQLPKLWLYHLHYHEYLWACDYNYAKQLVEAYIEQQTASQKHMGWESYPLSLRLMAWGAYFYGVHRQKTLADTDFNARLQLEMARMAEVLRTHMETHIGANHLLENALALAFVSCCFKGPTANRLRGDALKWLQREWPEQICQDGGHYERSPMYQSRILLASAWVCQVARHHAHDAIYQLLSPYLEPMAQWLENMTHPDGDISLFQDAALGHYPQPSQIFEYMVRNELLTRMPLAQLVRFQENTGYATATNSYKDCLIIDMGNIQPDYQPGHAHAGWGSFEWSVAGKRCVSDTGNYDYTCSAERRYARSTEAHSTLQVNGKDQAALWRAFRVGRRGQCRDAIFTAQDNGFELSGSHDGYSFLTGAPIICRMFKWDGEARELTIVDSVRYTSQADTKAVSRLWFHPNWCANSTADGWFVICDEQVIHVKVMGAEIIEGECYMRFGQKQQRIGLAVPVRHTLTWHLTVVSDKG